MYEQIVLSRAVDVDITIPDILNTALDLSNSPLFTGRAPCLTDKTHLLCTNSLGLPLLTYVNFSDPLPTCLRPSFAPLPPPSSLKSLRRELSQAKFLRLRPTTIVFTLKMRANATNYSTRSFPGSDIGSVFKRLCLAVNELDKQLGFQHDESRGYLSSCPTNLGTGMRASVHVKIPNASEHPDFKKICDEYHIQVSRLNYQKRL